MMKKFNKIIKGKHQVSILILLLNKVSLSSDRGLDTMPDSYGDLVEVPGHGKVVVHGFDILAFEPPIHLSVKI
jgi:hypothetical protein